MNQFDFYIYLVSHGVPKKVCSDHVSKIKRIEKSIKNCDLDDEYYKDCCSYLLSLFENKGENEKMEKALIGNLPIGKYTLSTFTYSIRKYITFMDDYTGRN